MGPQDSWIKARICKSLGAVEIERLRPVSITAKVGSK
jgi:hypothetical protein